MYSVYYKFQFEPANMTVFDTAEDAEIFADNMRKKQWDVEVLKADPRSKQLYSA